MDANDKKPQDTPTVAFSLEGLLVNEFSIISPGQFAQQLNLTPEADFTALHYTYGFRTTRTIQPERDGILIRLAVDLLLPESTKPDDSSPPKGHLTLASIECSFAFQLPDLKRFMSSPSNANIPDELFLSMVGLAFSTLRGIMWDKFSGTHLNGVFLPVVHPRVVLGDPKPTS